MKCPNCKTEMEISNGVATCPKCGARYRVKESDEETDEIRQPVQNVEMANEPEASEVDEVQELKRRLAEMEKKQAEMENRESNGRNFASKLSSIKSGKVGEFFKKWGLKVILPCVLALILIISLSVSFAGIRGVYIDEKNPAEFISFGPSDFELHSIDAGEEIVDKGKWKKKGNTIYLIYQGEDFGDVTEELTIKGFSNKRFTVVDEFETETTYKRVSLINFKNLKKKTKVVFINDGKETVKKVKVGTYLNMDEELEKDGYVFMGWYTSEEGWKDPNAKRVRFPQRIWEKATYFANWKDIRDYKININGVSEELTAKEGDLIYNAIKATENDGYIYKYSYFDNGEIIIDENTRMPAHDISVSREKISGAPIKIMLDADGGVLADDKQTITIEYGNWETYLPIPEKEDYTFTGWKIANTDKFFTDENGKTNRWYDFENYDKKGLKLVATYVVTFEIEGTTLKKYNGKDTDITIPDGVISIGKDAFRGFDEGLASKKLTSITIPASMMELNSLKSLNRLKLTSVVVKEGNAKYVSKNNCIIDKESKELVFACVNSIIPDDDSVTSIGGSAFRGCTGLTSITIPDSVTSIGERAFSGCSGLTSITIPNSVTSIGNSAFYGCTGLTSVTIGNSVTSIGNNAFTGCTGLTSITIPNSVTRIGDYAFYNCTGLTSVTIPNSVTSIGGSAFYGCTGLTSITIPNSVTSIGSSAFSGCSSLESITIPFVGAKAGVTSSDTYQYPFGYIFGTYSYTGGVATNQDYYGSSTSSTTNTTYYIPSSLKFVTVTGGNILYGAFSRCTGLTSVTIGNSVTRIGSSAFSGCTGLTSIIVAEGNSKYHSDGNCLIETATKTLILGCKTSVIPTDGSVTSIGSYAFEDCRGLTSITIPDSVTSIGSAAFWYCTGLASVTIGNSVTSIGRYAFMNCTGLTNITIPDSVTSIGDRAFYDTTWYNNQPDGLVYAGKVAYKYKGTMPSNTSIVLKEGTLGIGYEAFYNCKGLTSITIPNSVTSIGGSAFYGCTGLTNVTIPNSVTSIGSYAFEDCRGLTSITIPDSVTSIGSYAFDGCSGLASVTIGNSVTSIGYKAFYNCTKLTSVTIGNSVTSIGSYAFYYCTELTSIKFNGTKAQWNAIDKDYGWNYNTGNYVVHCTDGDISKANS